MTLITAAQLVVEYRILKNDMKATLKSASVHVDSLSRSVWNFDEKQIGLTLEVLLELPYVELVEVNTSGAGQSRTWSLGNSIPANVATEEVFPLYGSVLGQRKQIGAFMVTADLRVLHRRILDQVIGIFLSNSAKTAFVSVFMLFLFHKQIGLRLARLLPASGTDESKEAAREFLKLAVGRKSKGDEIDQLSETLQEIYQRYEKQAANLTDALNLQRAIFDGVLESVVVIDKDGTVLTVNHSTENLFGFSRKDVVGKNVSLLMPESDASQHSSYLAAYERTGKATVMGKGRQVTGQSKSGELMPIHLSVTRLQIQEEVHYVGVMRDLRDELKAAELVHHLAYHDALTDCANRVLLIERTEKALAKARRSGWFQALLFLDIDRFKQVNDLWGHGAGDDLLKQLVVRIKRALGPQDTLARIGGDEFIVLLEDVSDTAETAAIRAADVATQLLGQLSDPFPLRGGEVSVTASIGIGIDDGGRASSAEDLIREADMAMFKAKMSGRNMSILFEKSLHDAIVKRDQIERDLHEALKLNQMELYLQPQFDDQGVVFGAEALLRWQHPEHGWVSPADFVPIAEQTNLIVDLGDWVFTQACEILARWQANARLSALTLSVNVSVRQCGQADFVQKILACTGAFNVSTNRLKLEITESMFLDHQSSCLDSLITLKKAGIRLSLDDFGTGYSSLSYLARLPLDEIKIDRSFVQQIDADSGRRILVQSIIGMAHNLGLDVIAEGVETKAQAKIISDLGCGRFQGFLLGRPMPQDQFEQLAASPAKTELA